MAALSFLANLFRLLLLLMWIIPIAAGAGENQATAPSNGEPPWSFTLRGGSLYQFDTDLDERGGFRINRFFIQGGPVYSPEYRRSIALTVGYGFDGYDFAGKSVFSNSSPWEEIHTVRLATLVRWGMDNDWSVYLLPSLRFTAESGANWNDALTGGVFAGAAYRFSDQLTIGPGLGIMSQLEDKATIFPILLIDWKITGRLSLETGQGPAATQGPGLTLDWRVTERWHLVFGGRYEKHRFRLDKNGNVPGGIGENTSFPLFTGATYEFSRKVRANVAGGVELGGELRQEDRDGRFIAADDYDPALFFGVTLAGRF